jgi:hypothetical protein
MLFFSLSDAQTTLFLFSTTEAETQQVVKICLSSKIATRNLTTTTTTSSKNK